MQLPTMQEIQKVMWLFSRAGLNQVEIDYANNFFQKVIQLCTPPKSEETDALAIADALDKVDEEKSG